MSRIYNESPIIYTNTDGHIKSIQLLAVPKLNTICLYVGGLRQKLGVDYTIRKQIITFSYSPLASEPVVVDYES